MKHHILVTSILALTASFFIFDQTRAASSDIIINEIGASPTSTHEWIEIWNKGADPIDLIGWKFWENSTNHGLTATTTDSIVAPGEYAAICQNSTAFILDHPAFGGSIFGSSWSSLNESGEEVGLKDAGGNFVEQFIYISAPEHSLERKNPLIPDYSAANWQQHLTGDTLGLQNSNFTLTTETATTTTSTPPTETTTTPYSLPTTPSTSSLWAQIKINEFLPNPESGEEWVELYNPTTSSLNLADGTLCDDRTTSCVVITTNGTILAQDWATFFLNGSHLNNDGDSIILKNPDGVIVDQITYGTSALKTPDKGQTVARKLDGADTNSETDWIITTSLTPSASNVIVEPPAPAPAPVNTGGGGGGSSGGSVVTMPIATSAATASTASKSTTSTTKVTAAPNPITLIWKITAPRAAAPQEIVTLSALGSVDPRGGAILMNWNLGDGTNLEGQMVEHAFTTSGIYRVTVFATTTQKTIDRHTFSITIAPGNSAQHNGILISEIFPNPPGVDQDEFIELFNVGTTSTALSGWKLETSGGKNFTIPENTTIKPGENLVFYRAATHLVLNNTNESIMLKTADDVTMDQVVYEKSIASQSLSLVNGVRGWTAEITPGFLGITPGRVLGEKITTKTNVTGSVVTRPSQRPVRLALADARALKKGTAITVQGVVTVPLGNFSARYFYLGDASGGLQIYSTKGDPAPVAIGDKIIVTGAMSSAYGAPRLNIKAGTMDVLATDQPIEPEMIELGEIDEGAAGKLVVVKGEITDLKGNQLYLDDGETEAVVYLKTAAHIDKTRLKSGDTLQVTGIVEQTTNGWQILPRNNADIVIILPTKDTPSSTTNSPSIGSLVRKKYIAATLAGVAGIALAIALRLRLNKP